MAADENDKASESAADPVKGPESLRRGRSGKSRR